MRYNSGHHVTQEYEAMPKRKREGSGSFGERLVQFREAAGYTQQELADEVSVSRRMIAYYEGQSTHPPTTLLTAIATALNVTTDALLGVTPPKRVASLHTSRFQRRLQQLERLGAREKRQVLQFLDMVLERDRLKRQSQGVS